MEEEIHSLGKMATERMVDSFVSTLFCCSKENQDFVEAG